MNQDLRSKRPIPFVGFSYRRPSAFILLLSAPILIQSSTTLDHLFIEGVSDHKPHGPQNRLTCLTKLPKNYRWHDLKDLVREKATHGIWTEMVWPPDCQTGGVGLARLQRSVEAENLYRKSEGQW